MSAFPDFTATRSLLPSALAWMRTRVGLPVEGSSSITFDAAIGASYSMIPPSGFCSLGRVWCLRMFTPSTTSRFFSGSTRSTVPSAPAKFPRITLTRSPRRTCTLERPFFLPPWALCAPGTNRAIRSPPAPAIRSS